MRLRKENVNNLPWVTRAEQEGDNECETKDKILRKKDVLVIVPQL